MSGVPWENVGCLGRHRADTALENFGAAQIAGGVAAPIDGSTNEDFFTKVSLAKFPDHGCRARTQAGTTHRTPSAQFCRLKMLVSGQRMITRSSFGRTPLACCCRVPANVVSGKNADLGSCFRTTPTKRTDALDRDLGLSDCEQACNFDSVVECAPGGGHDHAAVLTGQRALWSSNVAGLRYPRAECSRRVL